MDERQTCPACHGSGISNEGSWSETYFFPMITVPTVYQCKNCNGHGELVKNEKGEWVPIEDNLTDWKILVVPLILLAITLAVLIYLIS